MSISDCIIMLLVDFVLYFFLAIYLDNVIPGEFGRAKSPFFCFMPSYWSGIRNGDRIKPDIQNLNMSSDDFEPVEDELRRNDAALK